MSYWALRAVTGAQESKPDRITRNKAGRSKSGRVWIASFFADMSQPRRVPFDQQSNQLAGGPEAEHLLHALSQLGTRGQVAPWDDHCLAGREGCFSSGCHRLPWPKDVFFSSDDEGGSCEAAELSFGEASVPAREWRVCSDVPGGRWGRWGEGTGLQCPKTLNNRHRCCHLHLACIPCFQ